MWEFIIAKASQQKSLYNTKQRNYSMPENKRKHFLEAVATLVGMIIGAGILGIPYAVANAGFLTGLLDIILIGLAVLVLNLYVGEIMLRTKDDHQLTGYAEKYLGKFGKSLMIFSMIFGLYGALVAYTLKEGEFLAAIFAPNIGGTPLIYSIIFFLVAAFLIYKGIKAIERSELVMVFFIVFIISLFIAVAFPFVDIKNLTAFSPQKLFLPYGVILFAFLGAAAIPEVGIELKENKTKIKKAIVWGSLIPLIVYVLFTFIVVGVVSPEKMTDDAIIGFGNALGHKVLLFGLIFGMLTMATSFIAVGLALKEMYNFDFKCSNDLSTFLACFVPLVISVALILIKVDHAFFKVIDITGIVSGGVAGILIILMVWKAKKLGERKPEYSVHSKKIFDILLILMFLAGMVYESLKIIGLIKIY